MKRLLSLCACVMVFSSALAQKPPIKFGDIPMEHMQMKIYPRDSSASAVVLADYGESILDYANNDFVLRFERIYRLKILTREGLEWGNISIPLYRSGGTDEDLGSVKAVTYNLEGGKIAETKMKNDAIFKEEVDENLTRVKLALPNVKEGSVVEVTYKITSPFIYNFQDWDFQTTIPTIWSEYRTRIPDWFYYKRFVQGYLPMAVNETKSEYKAFNIHTRVQSGGGSGRSVARTEAVSERVEYNEEFNRLVVSNAPAFKPEPYLTTYRDYISRINFELSVVKIPGSQMQTYNASWEDLNKDILKRDDFGGVIRGSGFLKQEVETIVSGKTDPKEKAAAIYLWVKSNIEWDGRYRKYTDGNLRQVLNSKKGSSAEINLMLVSMLQKAGFASNPVLISTRDHGFVRQDLPVSSQFNYVIAVVDLDGKQVLLDATDRALPMNFIPKRCINGQGFMVSETNPGWIPLASPKAKTLTNVEFVLSDEGKFKGKVQFTHDGYFGRDARRDYYANGKDQYVKELTDTYQWVVTSSEFENLDKLSESVKEVHQVELNEHLQTTADRMYLNPILLNRLDKSPFTSETRSYPVDYASPEERLYMVKIVIPEGWDVEEMPQPKALVMPANSARYVYNITRMGNTINLSSQLIINKPLFSQEEYGPLRDFYAQIVAKQAEQVVLRKK